MKTHRALIGAAFALTAAVLILMPAYAYADSCEPVFDALAKVVTTPSHSYTTRTVNRGKPADGETVFVGGKVYIRARGKWMHNPVTPDEILQQEKENEAKATCRLMRSEVDGGEPAGVYSLRRETAEFTEDSQLWISKVTGRLLREEQDMTVEGQQGRDHRSARFEYGDIRPPI
jgi:hypothetical protein